MVQICGPVPITQSLSVNFQIHPINTEFRDVGGIYMFCTYNSANKMFTPVYIGKASNLANRISYHDRIEEAKELGAKYILVTKVDRETTREQIEKILIGRLNPKLNCHFKTESINEMVARILSAR